MITKKIRNLLSGLKTTIVTVSSNDISGWRKKLMRLTVPTTKGAIP